MYDFEAMINRIKTIKKANKLSNESLAKLSGIPKGTLSKILGSETKDPQISNIIKIAQALGVTADYIIFGKEEPKYNDTCLKLFSMLNSDGQNKVLDYMHDLIKSNNYSSVSGVSFSETIPATNNNIDKIVLASSPEEERLIYRAAMSSDNHEHQIEKRSISDLSRLANAERVTSEEDL